jgi:hypothetical protein
VGPQLSEERGMFVRTNYDAESFVETFKPELR